MSGTFKPLTTKPDPNSKPKEKKLKKTLKEEEVIAKDEPLEPKHTSPSMFIQTFMQGKQREAEMELDLNVYLTINKLEDEVKHGILSNQIELPKESEKVEDIVVGSSANHRRDSSLPENVKIEESLKYNKEYIENKIKALDSNINMLEVSSENINNNSSNVIESNIRLSRIKEIKMIKENLGKKLITVEEQISNLLDIENAKDKKKLDVKAFLENFERDKRECKKLVDAWEREMLKREKENEERIKRESLRKEQEIQRKKEEEIEKINKRKQEHHEISMRMNERNSKIKQEIADSMIKRDGVNYLQDKYLYNIMEDKFKIKVKDDEEEVKTKRELALNERKSYFAGRIRKSDLDQFQQKVEGLKKERILQMEKDRLLQLERIKQQNDLFEQRKENSKTYIDAIKLEKELKEREIKLKSDNSLNSQKIKKFSEFVKEHIPIHSSPNLIHELETRVDRLLNPKNTVNHHPKLRKNVGVKFHKFSEESKKYYKWDIDLKKSIDFVKNIPLALSRENSAGKNSSSFRGLHTEGNESKKNLVIDIRKPLDKKPNYLPEIKGLNRSTEILNTDGVELNERYNRKWDKALSKIDNIYSSIDEVKIKTRMLESKLALKEQYLHALGGTKKYPEIGREIGNLLTSSIQAKLALIKKLNEC